MDPDTFPIIMQREWVFDILEHNHNHLPIHANNQKVKISKVIQKFMDKS